MCSHDCHFVKSEIMWTQSKKWPDSSVFSQFWILLSTVFEILTSSHPRRRPSVGQCVIESNNLRKMMHVLDWRALSNDSVVDVTPGVERWHTLWFMWESPRCPEHLVFTTKTLTIVHCFIATAPRDCSAFRISFILSLIRTHDALQSNCKWSAQAKTPCASFGIMSSDSTNPLPCA